MSLGGGAGMGGAANEMDLRAVWTASVPWTIYQSWQAQLQVTITSYQLGPPHGQLCPAGLGISVTSSLHSSQKKATVNH